MSPWLRIKCDDVDYSYMNIHIGDIKSADLHIDDAINLPPTTNNNTQNTNDLSKPRSNKDGVSIKSHKYDKVISYINRLMVYSYVRSNL